MTNPGGARTKLTKKRQAAIVEAITLGLTLRASAKAAKVSYGSLNLWRNKGKEVADQIEAWEAEERAWSKKDFTSQQWRYYEFFNAVEDALGDLIQIAGATVFTAATQDPNWAYRLLRLHFPDDYSERQQLDITSGNQPIQIHTIVAHVPPDE